MSRYNTAFRFKYAAALIAVLCFVILLSGCAVKSIVTEDLPEDDPVAAQYPDAGADTNGETAEPKNTSTPAPTSAGTEEQQKNMVEVSSVDDFLAALAPDTVVVLTRDLYNLSSASDYGEEKENGAYTWENCFDGFQLVIHGVDGLEIRASGRDKVTVSAVPRYANVLTFRNCRELTLTGFTAGHTEEPGFCSGGVLEFESCESVSINDCGLFGCGTLGVNAIRSRQILTVNSEIYECSYGAVSATGCFDVELRDCMIRDCGTKDESFHCFNLLEAVGSTGFALVNCDLSGNHTEVLLRSEYADQVCLLGCGFTNNTITDCAFKLSGMSPTIEGCEFTGNKLSRYYAQDFNTYAVSAEGEDLITFDFDRMKRSEAVYDGPQPIAAAAPKGVKQPDGSEEYHVTTVDEFLAALGPDRTIYLDAELFDLAKASGYGGYGSEYYHWDATYDGPTLVINDVQNLHLEGLGKEKTLLQATPMYADVLRFMRCDDISIKGLTAGHAEMGECAGDVLSFDTVSNLQLYDCGLYGCGVWGIRTVACSSVNIENCEIYSCSYGAIVMLDTVDVTMNQLNIHDMPEGFDSSFYGCERVTCDGRQITGSNVSLAA